MAKLELYQVRELSTEGIPDIYLNVAKPAVCRIVGDFSMFFRILARVCVTGVGSLWSSASTYSVYFSAFRSFGVQRAEVSELLECLLSALLPQSLIFFFFFNESLEFLWPIFLSSPVLPSCILRLATLHMMDRVSITRGDTEPPFSAAAFGVLPLNI